MTREEIALKWLEQVDEDIVTAEALYTTGHWLYIGFLCHQAIEKVIKAYWFACRDDEPIYLHNHFRLLEGCGLKNELSDVQRRFIEIMAPMYIAGRYPEYKSQVARMLNEKGSAYLIEQTKQFREWILQKCSHVTKLWDSSDNTSK
jgi:HEPN domain-containing protein